MNKKPLLILSIGLLLVSSCNKKPDVESVDYKDLPIYTYDSQGKKYVKSDKTFKTAYFNNSAIPYIKIKDYVENVLRARQSEDLIEYEYCATSDKTSNGAKVTTSNYVATCYANVTRQTITYSTYSGYFSNYKTQKEYTYPLNGIILGGEYLFKNLTLDSSEGKYSNNFVINLKDFNLKAYSVNDEIYLPYNVCISAFGTNHSNVPSYNGNGYYDIPSPICSQDYINTWIKPVKNSASETYLSKEYMEYAYNHLAFSLKSSFCLDERKMRSGDKELHSFFQDGDYYTPLSKYKERLTSLEPNVSNNALIEFFNEYVNDGGHSGYEDFNILCDTVEGISKRTGDFNFVDVAVSNHNKARKTAGLDPETKTGKSEFDGYVEKDSNNVLYVTFDSFMDRDEGSKPQHIIDDNEYGKSAITIIGRANKMVHEDSSIKNVVIDLSCNTGGAGYIPVFILSWLNKGQGKFNVRCNKDKAYLSGTGNADVNLDGVYNEQDYLPSDVKVYFITSGATFSSGNYLAALADEVGENVKFIGSQTGGGSCNVSLATNAYGTSMKYSGYIQLCLNNKVDDKLVSDESGVRQKYFYELGNTDYSSYYDRETISNKILGKNN